jgi:hypothetical protein
MLEPRPASVNRPAAPVHAVLALGMLVLVAAVHPKANAACAKSVADPVVTMELIAPLMVHMGPALRLSLGDDGCLVVERPAYYAQPGFHAFRLEAPELRTLKAELAQASPARLDVAALRQSVAALGAANAEGPQFVVADGNMLRIRLREADGRHVAIQWRNLDQDLLNHPDLEGLVTLATLRDRLMELASDRRLEAVP